MKSRSADARTAQAPAPGQREYRVLGPLEVWDSGQRLPLGGPKQRALLALLLLHANEVLSTERLIGELWGEEIPATALKTVQVFVSRLRRVLEHDDPTRQILVTQPPGYVLRVEPGQLDLERFEALVASAHSKPSNDSERASDTFREALSLWRGAPLSDVAFEPFAQVAIPRLEELRLRAIEERIDADLAAGQDADLVPELQDLVARHPLRERLHAQLMLALYRSSRQAEALEVYRRARRMLADELGIDPSPRLQRLEAAILHQDRSLELPRVAEAPSVIQAMTAPEAGSGSPHPKEAQPLPPEQPGTPQQRRPQGRVRKLRVGVVGASLALAAILLTRASGPAANPLVEARSNSVAVVALATNSVVDDIPVGSAPGPIAIANRTAWVGNLNDRTVTRIDLPSRRAVKTFGLPAPPVSLTAGDGVVWIGNGYAGTLSRILVAYDQLSAPFFPGPSVAGLLAVAVSPGDLWLGLANNSLLRLDPASLRAKATIAVQDRPRAITVIDGTVWAIDFFSHDVKRVDPSSMLVTATIPLSGMPRAIAAGFGSIWVVTTEDDRLWQIDPRLGRVSASVPLGLSPTAVAAGADAVWVVGGQSGVLERINPKAAQLVGTLNLGRPIGGIAVVGSEVWLTIQ